MLSALAFLLMILGVAITLGVLIVGIIVMARGGETNLKWGNRLMRYRLMAQAFAVVMLMLGIFLAGHN